MNVNFTFPSSERIKAYVEMETQYIKRKIKTFGSEGVCSHCNYKMVCLYSTIRNRTGMCCSSCDGCDILVWETKQV